MRLSTVADPAVLDPADAIVRITRTAICGSDLHAYHEREQGLDHGTVMGHEFIGEVVEVGADVRALRVGARVLSPFTTSCGACYFCRSGLTARCERGQLFGWVGDEHGLHGAQAEYVRVPLAESTLVGIPDGVTDDEALLLGDVMSTGYYCALRADIDPRGTYAVVGLGPVGLMAIVGARELGAERLYAVDVVPERLAIAERFGAIPIDARTAHPQQTLRDATEGRGADAVLEAVGSPSASELALALVRPGGTISIVGVHNEPHFSISPTQAYDHNLTLRIGRCPARAMIDRLIPTVQAKRYPLDAIISHHLPLADGPEAYRTFDQKLDGCTKVVLTP